MRPGGIAALAFGAVLINTMPIWLGEMAQAADLPEAVAGLFGSLVLLSAAIACWGVRLGRFESVAGPAVVICLCLLAGAAVLPELVAALACVGLGAGLGVLSRRALASQADAFDTQRAVGSALAIGLVVALICYLVIPVFAVPAFGVLAVISLSLLIPSWGPAKPEAPHVRAKLTVGGPIHVLPFFVFMGAYWAFLEVFGRQIGDAEALPFWLLGSLVSGTIGSFCAARIPTPHVPSVRDAALLVAAVSGAASYVAPNWLILGITIIANGFALFLYFPLYLGQAGKRAAEAMATYLLGFAFGGIVGGLLIGAAGYRALAITILLCGLIGLAHRFRLPVREP